MYVGLVASSHRLVEVCIYLFVFFSSYVSWVIRIHSDFRVSGFGSHLSIFFYVFVLSLFNLYACIFNSIYFSVYCLACLKVE